MLRYDTMYDTCTGYQATSVVPGGRGQHGTNAHLQLFYYSLMNKQSCFLIFGYQEMVLKKALAQENWSEAMIFVSILEGSVADPGCLTRILIFIHPGSRISTQQQ